MSMRRCWFLLLCSMPTSAACSSTSLSHTLHSPLPVSSGLLTAAVRDVVADVPTGLLWGTRSTATGVRSTELAMHSHRAPSCLPTTNNLLLGQRQRRTSASSTKQQLKEREGDRRISSVIYTGSVAACLGITLEKRRDAIGTVVVRTTSRATRTEKAHLHGCVRVLSRRDDESGTSQRAITLRHGKRSGLKQRRGVA